jgi:Concanavalin A-like lectin/glucanases superfamily
MWMVLLVSCGRLEFDPLNGSNSAAPDAAPDAASVISPIHQYSFKGNLNDDVGDKPLVSMGGTLAADGYNFGINQGLRVNRAIPSTTYTVDILFAFGQLNSWQKILDFKGLTSDNGFYSFDDKLQFVIVAGDVFATSPSLFSANTLTQVTLTRDTSNNVNGYVNRKLVFTFVDTAAVAALTAADEEAIFFIDDTPTNGGEAAAGVVRRIRIYDRALTAEELQP